MKPIAYIIRKRQIVGLSVFAVVVLMLQGGFFFLKNRTENNRFPIEFLSDTPSETPLVLSEFDPNLLDEKQWKNLGFSDRQIATILKYKKIVGGTFSSKEQFRKCYAISAEKYDQLKDFILLPETTKEAKSENFSSQKYQKKSLTINGKFNPDHYTDHDWMALGFSEKQASAILKYKKYLGGSFISKEKFRECFIISAENYQKLAPYLLLPEKTPENQRPTSTAFARKEKQQLLYQNFDPNQLDADGWKALGFSEKQAAAILNYKNKNLRGSFRTAEDIRNCFVISEEKFRELKPYILLQPQLQEEKTIVKTERLYPEKTNADKTDFTKTDLNKITFAQLREFGFDERAAATYIGFRKKLGGFVTTKQIIDTYNLDKSTAEKLVKVCPLDVSDIQKYTLADAPEEWLRNHPYFKYSADKILFYRVTYPDDEKIWKFLKKGLKPEYEERMRLYLK